MIKKLLPLVAVAASSIASAQLPPGFSQTTPISGLSQPTAMTFTPDGRMLLIQKQGALKVYQGSNLLSTPLTLNVSGDAERGLLGIAVDPSFTSNGFIYLYYTTSSGSLNPPATPKNRVSRFTMMGNQVVSGSELILVDEIPSNNGNHNAGCLRFGPDGRLYIATGDGGTASNAQSLSNLAGKILRINKDGSIPSGNPFVNTAGARDEIYLYGLRNPFRFSFRPSNGAMFIGDVGQSSWEEVNVGVEGGNYGWPNFEGPANTPGFIDPVYAYAHTSTARASITGGIFMDQGRFPPGYDGAYFFGDYVRDVMGRLNFNSSNQLTNEEFFGPAVNIVDLAEGPDGALWWININGSVNRIVYRTNLDDLSISPSNPAPSSTAKGTVRLDLPAPADGAVVALTSSNTGVATVPTSVTIPGGQTSAQFNISVKSASAGSSTTITAKRGSATETATLTVGGGNNAEFVSQNVPTTMEAGKSYNVTITMRNIGDTSWSDATGYRLMSRNPPDNKIWGTSRMFIASGTVVDPGESYVFTKTVRAPSTPGIYNFQWKMLHLGTGSFGESTPNLTVNVVSASNDAQFMWQSVPTSVNAGATFTASLNFMNTGSSTWTDASGFRLMSRDPADNTRWGTNRVFIDNGVSVPPGANYTFTRQFVAPSTPGIYKFTWKMLNLGSGSFGDESVTVNITVN